MGETLRDEKDRFQPVELDSAPIAPGARRGPLPARAWVVRIVVAYLLYAVGCFAVEGCGRARFQVPSKADVAAVTERKAHVRAEMLRLNRHEEMASWPPRAAVEILSLLLSAFGLVGMPILTFRYLWRKRSKEGVVFIKLFVVAVLLPGIVVIFLALGPLLIAERLYDDERTGVPLPPAPTPAPSLTPASAGGAR